MRHLDDMVGFRRSDAINGSVSLILGGFVGWAFGELASDPAQVGLWAIIGVSAIALIVCFLVTGFLSTFQREGRDRLDVVETIVEDLRDRVVESVDAAAVLVPRESIYFEMARCIREAQDQVVVLTYFMYDWDKNERLFAPTVQGEAPGVQEFYDSIYTCIGDPEVDYRRIWQVPGDQVKAAESIIRQEPRLAKEMDLINEVSQENPERCRLRIIPAATTASIILIDRKTLFFNVDFRDAATGMWKSPFMLMVKDARGRAFQDMKRVLASLD